MSKKTYNKLVRDKIPEIIADNGSTSKIRILNQQEYLEALLEKMVEEAVEVKEAGSNRESLIKELGDVKEVMLAIMKIKDIQSDEVDLIRSNRKVERGAFEKRIFLEHTEDK